ncbi:MAG: type VI secretion system protein TssA [Desulfobacterales bacterium]|jgi:type VI secretion system protein ImpA|nr:type VI secretion system protein TssA [Desulfobacterales bacterium]
MSIDINAILTPIPGETPAGENLRYTDVYSDIKEARRSDDLLDKGEWQHEVKTSDWAKVERLAASALTEKTKDLQIAIWLTEALIKNDGFSGLTAGLEVINALLTHFWEHLYPEMDEGDLDFRAAPIEFLNEKLCIALKEIAVTDPRNTPGYSWLKWQESRQVGSEESLRNQWGDIDESRKQARDQKIAEGKITIEDFDGAVARSSAAFYISLLTSIDKSRNAFKTFDRLLDETFGNEAPRLAEFRSALDDCYELVAKLHKEKVPYEPVPDRPPESAETLSTVEEPTPEPPAAADIAVTERRNTDPLPISTDNIASISHLNPISDLPAEVLWNEALQILTNAGIKTALTQLMSAACSAPSIREKNRYRLIIAKLCLRANRLDLARPIAEELYTLIEALNLEKWESPVWIGEVIDTLYQCLTKAEDASDNVQRAGELLERLCRTDVTKAMSYNV